MDTLTTPVLLVTIATNSRETRFCIGPSECYIGKTIHRVSQSTLGVSLRQPVSEDRLRQLASEAEAVSRQSEMSVQCSSDSMIQEATSAKVFTIIVICVVDVNLHSE
jgi:hypothetical protein